MESSRGGGGGHFHIIVHIGYVPFERPPFSALNFCSRAYHFHKWPPPPPKKKKKKKNPLRSITILQFLRYGDHHFQNFFTVKLFRRRPRPVHSAASSAPGLQPARVPARRVLQVSSRDPHFTLEPAPEPRIFMLEPAPETRIFTLDSLQRPPFFTLPWHVPTNIWGECPPPPPPALWWSPDKKKTVTFLFLARILFKFWLICYNSIDIRNTTWPLVSYNERTDMFSKL